MTRAPSSLRWRKLAAVVVSAAFGIAAAVRVGAVEPSLDIRVFHAAHNARFDVWNVMVSARGGEPIDEVAIEPVSGPVSFEGGTWMKDLPPQWRVSFEVHLENTAPSGMVRILQKGKAPRSYEVIVGGAP